jgi:3-phenylpropionate/trans-cinnamate dioxygenase ferredoxin reductase subunit
MLGLQVTLLVGDEVLLGRQIGQGAGRYLMDYFKSKGVTLETKAQAVEFLGSGKLAGVKLKDGRQFSGGLAVVGVGVTPRTTLAGAAGLPVENGVLVDSHFRTADPDVFAAGDVANFVDPRYGRRFRIEHWDHAKASGKTAGLNMAGQEEPFDRLHYFFSDMFDLELEAWGDMYQNDEIIEQPADTRAPGHPAWHYLDRGRLVASALVNANKGEHKAIQVLLKGKPEADAALRRKLSDGSWFQA